ncbi:MAG: hypothetical protein ACK522_08970 [Synechococcaceae cyanobacterium]
MSISPASEPSRSISRSEYLSSLPRWRRWLAMLNWRPVVDLEIRAIERKKLLSELRSDSEQIEKDSERIANETEQLRRENARYAELNARLDAICSSFDTSSPPPPPTPGPSPT